MLLYLLAILSLGVLIIIHEGGHFLVARLSGMRVDRFSVGFGPPLFKFKRGETIYQIGMIPLGGFVQIAGLNPGEMEEQTVVERDGKMVTVDKKDDPRMYPNRPVYQRLATIFAGPGTNYLFAAVLMAIICVTWGVPVAGKLPIVADLQEGMPAAAAGVEVEDELISLDGKDVKTTAEVSTIIDASQGRPVAVALNRDGQRHEYTITPKRDESLGRWRIGIGLTANDERERQPIGSAAIYGLKWPWEQTKGILGGLADVISGKQKPDFTGPVGIVKEMKKRIAKGPVKALEIIAIISVYLGLFNLLPLPALDGGRLVFLAIEGVSRRRVNQRIEGFVHLGGMLVMFSFLIYVVVFGKHDVNISKYFK